MTRRTKRQNRAQSAPATVTPIRPEQPRRALHLALDTAPHDGRSPSMIAATPYKVDEARYSTVEKRAAEMAMDFNGTTTNALTFTESQGFPGFPALALLAQLPEYRSMHERLADECIRKWGKPTSSGESDSTKVAQIVAELDKLDIKSAIRQMVIHDQAFGGAHAYFKLKGDDDLREIALVMKPISVPQGAFMGLRVIEPYWVTPNAYNSIDPSAADFYKPSSWFMIGQEVHASRLQTIVSRPVPDMLKPSYSFRGVSMSQLAAPYVDNWLRTRQSVSDAIKQYAVSGVKMDLQQMLSPGGASDLRNRIELLNRYRDNRNLLAVDMATEEFFTVATPISGLDALQAQAQEQMSAVCHIPLVVLLGITPTGLNASSEGEIRVFYDYVSGYQSNVLHAIMLNILRIIQLSLFGEIDESISWKWEPLHELTSLEAADKRAKDADTDSKYVEMGVVAPETVMRRLNDDPDSGYSGLLEAGDTLDTTPDDDIATITEHILQMPIDGDDSGLEAAPVGGAFSQLTDGQESASTDLLALTGGDPTITDEDEQSDPGVLPTGALADIGEAIMQGVPVQAAGTDAPLARQPLGGATNVTHPSIDALNATADGMVGPAGDEPKLTALHAAIQQVMSA
jgi:phage-related protein (TIGR01555 family)